MREKAGAVLTEEVPAEAGGKWGTSVDAGAWVQVRACRGVGVGAWVQGSGLRGVGAGAWAQARGCRSSSEGGGWCGGSCGRGAGGDRKG